MKKILFNRNHPEFFGELRKRVNAYFKENNISTYGDSRMVFKTIVMLLLYFTPLIIMLTGKVTGFFPLMALWMTMGFGMAGIGMSIMHDANHQAYTKNKRVNTYLGYLINFVGAYHNNWIIQHNMLHHTYTNIDGYDEDIEISIMRFSPDQERKKYYKYQAFYGPFLYGLMTLNWLFYKDFGQLYRYKKQGLLRNVRTTYSRALTVIILNKLWYIILMLVLPILLVDAPWWYIIIGFFTMHFITGAFLSFVFQSAHVLDNTHFFSVDTEGNVENNWAIHQMKTTANFAHGSTFLSWFIGGLNYQIEHHLFPHICHIHYKKMSEIVRQVAAEYRIPYNEHKTFLKAISSHMKVINQLGTGRYDKQLALAEVQA